MDTDDIIAKGKRCIELEIAALEASSQALGESFVNVVRLLHETLQAGNKIIFSGIGKNAHICEKLVGTFNSIGAPACFLDPVRALHGDLGLCSEKDALLAFSNKGETEELLRFIPFAKRFDVTTIAVTSNESSSMAQLCDATLPYKAEQEACPLDLAPTASAAASMAIGDALAMVLLELKALSKEAFARFHPAGSIGRSLSPRVDQVMRQAGSFALLAENANCKACLQAMSDTSSGSVALVDDDGSLSGILTDGDIRRIVLAQPDFLDKPVSDFMTRSPITIQSGAIAVEALKIFETHSIDDLIVVDSESRPIGLIDGQDLTKVRLV